MTTNTDIARAAASSLFDALKHEDVIGEYWLARDLERPLGYDSWRRFEESIERAMIAVNSAGMEAPDHIANAVKMVDLGSGARRAVTDYRLTRFGAYMVAMNGDPRKPEIAEAQTYFAVKTREAEVTKPALTEDQIVAQALQITARRVEVLESRVAELEPPAQAWEHLASTDGDLSANEAAKVLSRDPAIIIGEGRLWRWLDEHRWTYRDATGDRRAYQDRIDSGHLAARARGHHHPSSGEWIVDAPQVRVTMRGLELIRRHLTRQLVAVTA